MKPTTPLDALSLPIVSYTVVFYDSIFAPSLRCLNPAVPVATGQVKSGKDSARGSSHRHAAVQRCSIRVPGGPGPAPAEQSAGAGAECGRLQEHTGRHGQAQGRGFSQGRLPAGL